MMDFERTPFLVIWELTRACDLACLHCRACAQPLRASDELDTAEGRRLLDEIAAMGTKVVVLTGGDPAKRPDLVELVRYGASLGLQIALTPSATPLVTDDLLLDLGEAGLARLAVSLDGITRVAHDRFRGVDGSFDRTFEILTAARSMGLRTQVNTTVTSFNVDELERIAAALGPLGIDLWSVFVLVPTGRGADLDVLRPDVVENVLERLARIAERTPFDVKTTAAPHYRRVLMQREVKARDIAGVVKQIGRAQRGVNDGLGIAFVSHVGEIFPSGFLPIGCGNVRTTSLSKVYREHPLFVALRRDDLLEGKCGACEFRKVCGGSRARAYALTDNAFAADPACAWIPRLPTH